MKKLLVVDDSAFVYKEIMRLITNQGYEIVGYAKDGEEGVRMYDELKPDVVTMDIIMPGIDGLEAAKEIIERDPAAANKIVMLSSLCDLDTMEEMKKLGIHDLVAKPLEPDVLLGALDRLCFTSAEILDTDQSVNM